MFGYSEIENYLKGVGAEFTSFDQEDNQHHIVKVNLTNGDTVKFEMWPNSESTDSQLYHFLIYNTIDGDEVMTYSNNRCNIEMILNKVKKYEKYMAENITMKINEADIRTMVKECVSRIVSEEFDYINGLLAHGDYDVPNRSGGHFLIKCFECYDDSYDDVIWVAAICPNGEEGIARKNLKNRYPTFEIASSNDVDGVVYVGDMTRNQMFLYDKKAARVEDPFDDLDGLEWNRFLRWPPRQK